MREFLEVLVRLPAPLMICAGLGLLSWRRPRIRRALFATAALGLLVLGLPAVGKALLVAQLATVSRDLPKTAPAAILVPTGGMYKVGDDEWWPSRASVERFSKARALAERYAGAAPIIVAGGSPWAGAPIEAEILLARAETGGARVEIDPESPNTAATADNLRRRFADAPGAVIVAATDRYHAARMAAALRSAGFEVVIALSDKYRGPEWSILDVVPQPEGLYLTSRVLRSWTGLGWYWLRGEIGLDDLAS